MTNLYSVASRCYYCPGCDKRDPCVDPLRRYVATTVFTVDGIRYDPSGEEANNGSIIMLKNDRWCGPDGCGDDCLDFTPQQHSNPPTETELNSWMNPYSDDGGV